MSLTQNDGHSSILSLDESGSIVEEKTYKLADNTIWATKVHQEKGVILKGGDFGKFHVIDINTKEVVTTKKQ